MLRNTLGVLGLFAMLAFISPPALAGDGCAAAKQASADRAASCATMQKASAGCATMQKASAGCPSAASCAQAASGACIGVCPQGATLQKAGVEPCSGTARACSEMMRARFASRGWLGVELESVDGLPGLHVAHVVPDGPAHQAGFRAGDVLTSVNGISFVHSPSEVVNGFMDGRFGVGRSLRYTALRSGEVVRLQPTLGRIPAGQLEQMISRHSEQHHAEEMATLQR